MCIVAGKSGGHLIPALELAKKWQSLNPAGKVFVFSNDSHLDTTIIQHYPWITATHSFTLETFHRSKWWLYPKITWQILTTFIKSIQLLRSYNPCSILTTGGAIAIPVCAAGKILNCPIDVYELNVVPGKATRILAYFATNIHTLFTKTKNFFSTKQQKRCHLTNYPVRFSNTDRITNNQDLLSLINTNKTTFPFDTNRKTIFIIGGSQGSELLNSLIHDFIEQEKALHKQIQIIHQTGITTFDWNNFYTEKNIPAFTFSFNHTIHHCYQLADIVIARAGAGTLFELLFFKKKTLIIPLVASTTDHQCENAYELMEENPALFYVLNQKSVQEDSQIFIKTLKEKLTL